MTQNPYQQYAMSPLPEDDLSPEFSKPKSWPIAIGVVSIVFGSMGLLNTGCGSAFMLMLPMLPPEIQEQAGQQASGPVYVLQIGQQCAGFILAGLLLFAGIAACRRKPSMRGLHLGWSGLKIAMALIVFAISMTMISDMVDQLNEQFSSQGMDIHITEGIVIIILVATALWAILWPVFLLIWFNLSGVKRDIDSWSYDPHMGAV